MNNKQMNVAQQAMTDWLSHPNELGKAPFKIECTGTFGLYDMTYYIFKYKKNVLGKWLLGVCGGYEGDSLEHCGHIFSEMEEYDEDTAVEKSQEMVEKIREYWIEEAKRAEENKESKGFVGFVLLSDSSWDKTKLISDLKQEWNIDVEEDEDETDETLIFFVDDMAVVLGLMSAPVPNGEAEINAENNYMWKDAVEITKSHKAHITVAILGNDINIYERGKLFVKVASVCAKQKNAIGVYTSGTVFEPRMYIDFSDMIKDGDLPILNWVWFGLYQSEKGVCAYTYGMETFGKYEIEVLDVDDKPSNVYDFIVAMASYVLEYDATLNDGETIGFSAEDKHSISLSDGVSLPQKTLKISYTSN